MKNLFFICFIFLSSQSFSQLSNLDFEEWDSINFQNNCCIEVPKDWHHGQFYMPLTQKKNFAHSGNWALGLSGTFGPADGAIAGFVQQKFRVPTGMDSIFAYVAVHDVSAVNSFDFCGFGLTKDTLSTYDFYPPDVFEAGWFNQDSIPEYKRIGFAVPSSLWGTEMYLTAYSFAIQWSSYPTFFIDDIDATGGTNSVQEFGLNSIQLSPNPTSNSLSVNDLPSTNFKTQIFDLKGSLISESKNETQINVSHLKSGTYLLRIEDLKTNKVWKEKFVKN